MFSFANLALLCLCVDRTLATNLFVSSYGGLVYTLRLFQDDTYYTLNQISTNPGCAPNPSWLTLDEANKELFCVNEGLNSVNGSLSSFTISGLDGSLKQQGNVTVPNGPVNAVVYGDKGNRAIALADYGAGAVTSVKLNDSDLADNKVIQNVFFPPPAQPGPVAGRQTASHAHQVILDPSGQYILSPDLGLDVVHVFSFDKTTDKLTQLTPLQVKPGTGPRHAAFWSPSDYRDASGKSPLFMYVVGELGQDVTGFAVTYLPNNTGLNFAQVYQSGTVGNSIPPGYVAPAEIQVAPDNNFIAISNRNDSSFITPNLSPQNATGSISDSIVTFKPTNNGTLEFVQLAAAYGRYPRNFALNKAGDKVAVGLQNDMAVAILERNIVTGIIGAPLASIQVEGQVTSVVWEE